MRIDIVTDTYAPDVNGVAMTLQKLVGQLRKKGHKVHLIHTADGADINRGETKVKSLPLPGYAEVRVGLPSYMRLRSRWVKKRPDVIYVATESPLGISALKAANNLNIPVAAGFHTNFHQYLKKYRLAMLKDVAMHYLKSVHEKADLTLTPSAEALRMLEEAGVKNVKLLTRGVDVRQFSPKHGCVELRREWGSDAFTPVAIIVGRVAAEKNLEYSLKLLEQLRQTTTPGLQVVVVGDGPMRTKLSVQYPCVHFIGVKRGHDLARCYASADLMVFSSETETFGNVMLEAMASGLVTASYCYAASKNYVQNGINGFHASKGDEGAFEASLVDAVIMYNDIGIREAARATVAAVSWDEVASDFEGHLETIIESKPAHKQPRKPDNRLKLRALFLSDIHLGCPESKTYEVIDMIKRVIVPRIYLNGDIVDCWALRRGEKWTGQHTKVIRVLLQKMEKEGTQLIYLRGNHDDIFDKALPLMLGGIKIQTEYVHESLEGKKYLVVHGDGFDSFSTKHKWVAKLGAFGYDALLKLNRIYNRYRNLRRKEPYSVSKAIKARVKGAVSFVENYHKQVKNLAVKRGCDGIIVGHIHTPADEHYGNIHYLNSGDWVESASSVVEYPDGKIEVLMYEDFCKILKEAKAEHVSCESVGELSQRNYENHESIVV